MITKKQIVFIILTSIAAICFKLWFITLSPQPIIFDQEEYRLYAQRIYQQILTGAPSRTYAYPMFVALNFLLFGLNNFRAIFISQAIIDVISGIILFYLALMLFKSQKIAYLTLFIQWFNPFTASYVGVLLTEVPAAFLIVLSILLFILLTKQKKLYLCLPLGFTVGLLTQVRPAFFYWNILVFFLVPYLFKRGKIINWRHFGSKAILLLISGTLLASSYQIISNLKLYRQFALTTVDSFFARELYDGALLKTTPLFPNKEESYPPEMRIMYAEYSLLPKNAAERKQMADKYFQKALELIKKDPLDYVLTRIKKMGSMWQKQNIFFYHEPDFEKHWIYTFVLNNTILAFAAYGLILGILSKNSLLRHTIVFVLSILFYMTFAISFTHAEPRLTIPAYPLLFLFASVGIITLFSKIFSCNNLS